MRALSEEMMSKTAFITGVTGQDGAYLAEYLLRLGYRVVGAFRRSSSTNFWRLAELGVDAHERLVLVEHDLTDLGVTIRLLQEHAPDEVYNLAAQSFVGTSFKQPVTTAEITGIGALHMLEAIRIVNPKIRFYQASSSEMFGKVQANPQSETTPFYPRSPYGVAKLFAHWSTVNYRESLRHLRRQRHPLQPRVARCAERSSSRARFPIQRQRSAWGRCSNCGWATSKR